MSRSKPIPKLLGNYRGLSNATISVAALVHKKPWLPFVLPMQIIVDENDKVLVDREGNYIDDETLGKAVMIGVEFHVQIDPQRITANLNNEVQATQDRLTAAQRIFDKMFAGQGVNNQAADARRMTKNDLPDQDLLVDCYRDRDGALDKRLLACVMNDADGKTEWDYVDRNGDTPALTWEFLEANPMVGDALQNAFAEWVNFSSKLSGADTSTTKETGTKDSTKPTAPAPSQDLPGPSSAPAMNESRTQTAGIPNG